MVAQQCRANRLWSSPLSTKNRPRATFRRRNLGRNQLLNNGSPQSFPPEQRGEPSEVYIGVVLVCVHGTRLCPNSLPLHSTHGRCPCHDGRFPQSCCYRKRFMCVHPLILLQDLDSPLKSYLAAADVRLWHVVAGIFM